MVFVSISVYGFALLRKWPLRCAATGAPATATHVRFCVLLARNSKEEVGRFCSHKAQFLQ